MIGFAAVAAVAAMALVGASSAMASQSTALCTKNENPCKTKAGLEAEKVATPTENVVSSVHFVNIGSPELKSTFLGLPITILCLESLALGTVEGTGLATAPNPLGVSITELTWKKCGTNAEHNNCKEIKTLSLPLFDVLNTGENKGTAIALGPTGGTSKTEVLVECTIAGVTLHCIYGGTEIKPFSVEGALVGSSGHGMFTATNLVVPMISGKNCPAESKWTALYEPLVHTFITT